MTICQTIVGKFQPISCLHEHSYTQSAAFTLHQQVEQLKQKLYDPQILVFDNLIQSRKKFDNLWFNQQRCYTESALSHGSLYFSLRYRQA